MLSIENQIKHALNVIIITSAAENIHVFSTKHYSNLIKPDNNLNYCKYCVTCNTTGRVMSAIEY